MYTYLSLSLSLSLYIYIYIHIYISYCFLWGCRGLQASVGSYGGSQGPAVFQITHRSGAHGSLSLSLAHAYTYSVTRFHILSLLLTISPLRQFANI